MALEDRVSTHRPRWWPAILILVLAAALWIWTWYFRDVDRQMKNLGSAGISALTVMLLLVWLVLFSRLRWATRGLIFASAVGMIALLILTLRVRGVTGDFVPVLEWRWATAELPEIEATRGATQAVPLDLSVESSFPQIYGPSRDGQLTGPKLAADWSANPPEPMWRQPIGPAWSGFAVSGLHAVTLEQRGDREWVTCYHLLTGDVIWSHSDPARFYKKIAGEGPRTVPTIVGDRVFTVGATGMLNCLSLADGSPIWSKNFVDDNDGSTPTWGISCSPLVHDGRVIVSVGGKEGRSLMAYDAASGEFAWSGGDGSSQYSSPLLTTLSGTQQVVIFNRRVVGHHASSGQVLWSYEWPTGHPHVAMPIIVPDGRMLVSSGYGTGCELVQIEQDESGNWSASQIWHSNRLKSKFANLLVRNGYVYGLDDGIFVCLDLENGELQWKRGRYGHGQILMIDDVILVMAENGDVVLLEASHERHRELTRFAALTGKTWNPPAVAGEYLVVRNDQEAACYRLPTRESLPTVETR